MSDINTIKAEMDKAIESLKYEFGKIRTGRANPAMLDGILIEAYGTPTPINQVALINIPEARQIQVKPYDPTLLKALEEGINKSNLGINPTNDGETIRLVIPTLTEESRKELTKVSKEKAENAKIKIRNIRKDANNTIKKNNDLTDDEKQSMEKNIQELTDTYNKNIENILKEKDEEIMTI